MKNNATLAAVAVTTALAATLCVAAADNPKSRIQNPKSPLPNIVFILADDLGWTDLGCTGSRYYETPNIDRLARQGMRFTSAYTMPNCAPTRACLQTGKYSPRTGIYTVGTSNRGRAYDRKFDAPENRIGLAPDIPTLPEMLRGSGYLTGLFGKWHLGEEPGNGPSARGYDSAVRYDGGSGHFDFKPNPAVKFPKGQFLADFLADQGIGFMRRARKENKPFLLVLAHFAVHTPLQAPKEAVEYFKGKPSAGSHKNPVYAAMIFELDKSVGRVLDEIDRLGIAGNTLVIFTSDNGGFLSSTGNEPLRGGKGMHYEGGIRVPWIARWPGVTKAGASCDTPIHAVDFAPTVFELARHAPPAGTVLDGRSFAPLMRGEPDKGLSERALFWHCPVYLEGKGGGQKAELWRSTPGAIMRQGAWKLIELFETGKVELYNLADDISESVDLAKKQPQVAAEMLGKLRAWRAGLNAPMPTPNADYHNPAVAKGEKKGAGAKEKKGADAKGKKGKKQKGAQEEDDGD